MYFLTELLVVFISTIKVLILGTVMVTAFILWILILQVTYDFISKILEKRSK